MATTNKQTTASSLNNATQQGNTSLPPLNNQFGGQQPDFGQHNGGLQQNSQMGNQQGNASLPPLNNQLGGQQPDFGQHNGGLQPNSQTDKGFAAFSMIPSTNDDVFFGAPKADKYNGLAGNDLIDGGEGNDSLDGGAGNDTVIGSAGKDVMSGGSGKDVFVFSTDDSSADKAGRDIIKDFKSGVDKIDLSQLLNAPDEIVDTTLTDTTSTTTDTTITTNDTVSHIAINYLGSAQFSATDATGQARLENGVLYVSTNADADAELSIQLTGVTSLTIDDFIF